MRPGSLRRRTSTAVCMSALASASTGRITTFSLGRRWIHWRQINIIYLTFPQCDTFSRSAQAVFELSTRVVEPWKYASGHPESVSESEILEAERLMFLELTQVCLWGNSTDLSLLINMTPVVIIR